MFFVLKQPVSQKILVPLSTKPSPDVVHSPHQHHKHSYIGGSVAIPNGVGYFNATFIGSVATYMCDDSVVYKRTYRINGSWSGSIPECEGYIIQAGKLALLAPLLHLIHTCTCTYMLEYHVLA